MTPKPAAPPISGSELVDEYFIENRTRLLDIAAFLDRLDRVDPQQAERDFRMRAFADAIGALASQGDRLNRIQLLLSDPTVEPLDRLDRKSAIGAYDSGTREARR